MAPRKKKAPRGRGSIYAKAGPVKVIAADGAERTERPYSRQEVRRIVREREPITDQLRARILRRDQGTCRYCGATEGPFEMDHVIARTNGGSTSMGNLVTACQPCNNRKGSATWVPTPVPRRL